MTGSTLVGRSRRLRVRGRLPLLVVAVVLLLTSLAGAGFDVRGAAASTSSKPAKSDAACRKAFRADVGAKRADQLFASLPTTLTQCRDDAQWERVAAHEGVVPRHLIGAHGPLLIVSAKTVLLFECASAAARTGSCGAFASSLAAPNAAALNATNALLPCFGWWTGLASARAGQLQEARTRMDQAVTDLLDSRPFRPVPWDNESFASAAYFAFHPNVRFTESDFAQTVQSFTMSCVEIGSKP